MTRKLCLPDPPAPPDARGRLTAPSAERNVGPIGDLLAEVAPAEGRALEIASGTGQHVAAFAARCPGLTWQPSDIDPERLESIAAWTADLPNVRPPLRLDATRPGWAEDLPGHDLVLLVNLLHLIPEAAARTAAQGAAASVAPGGVLLLYGPFRRAGRFVSAGDRDFDASLRAQDPAIGYKDDDTVAGWLEAAGLTVLRRVEMPANNLAFVARR